MINIVELFSGIGSQAKAFERLAKKRKIEFKVLNTCEWDVHAILAYDYIHNGPSIDKGTAKLTHDDLIKRLSALDLSNDGKVLMKKRTLDSYSIIALRRIYSSIIRTNNLINIEKVKGTDLPNGVTVMTYSFPCQDLSNVGALHGYNKGIDRNAKTRSGLLWEVERILIEREKNKLDMPKFLLLENVTALEANKNNKNFEEWKRKLKNLGYNNRVYKLYAPNFGIPQNRKRLLMISVFVGKDKVKIQKVDEYFSRHDLENLSYVNSLKIKNKKLKNFLHLDSYLEEACLSQPRNTPSRGTIWDKNSQILDSSGNLKNIVQTITTKQDRHPNSGNIYFKTTQDKADFRFLTPRECFLLMGFDERDYDILINNNFNSRKNALFFSRDKLYKLAGNSIVVNVLEAIFDQIIDINELINGGITNEK